MVKYYDILQVKDISKSINYLADQIGVDRNILANYLEVGSIDELIDFINYCKDRNYSSRRIIADKLNKLAIKYGLYIRFVPEDESFKWGYSNGIQI